MKAFSASRSWASPVRRRRPKGPQICLDDPAALFEEQLPLKPGHIDQALNPSAWPHLQALSEGPRAGDAASLFPLPLFQSIHFCEINEYQSASLRQYQFRESQISACTVITLKKEKKTDFECLCCIGHFWSHLSIVLFYLFAFVACWAQGNIWTLNSQNVFILLYKILSSFESCKHFDEHVWCLKL